MFLIDAREHECYDEAYQGNDVSKWELVMKDEMNSLISNQTWELDVRIMLNSKSIMLFLTIFSY